MRHLVKLLSLAMILISAVPLSAQDRLPVQIDVDHASFAYNESSSLVEVYMSVDAASLDFEESDEVFEARLPLEFEMAPVSSADIAASSRESVWADSVLLRFAVSDTSNIMPGQHFIHQVRTSVQPGEYELRMIIPASEEYGRPEVELRRDLAVPDFSDRETAALSGVTLASEITQAQDRSDPFYKNGLLIRPNANQLFGQGLDRLFYYTEAYGTDALTGDDDQYTVYTYVAEANRPQPVAGLEKRLERESRTPDVLVGQFDVGSLPSGSYFLRVALLNNENESVAERSRKFFIYNPDVEREQVAAVEMEFETSPYAAMTEDEVNQSLEHIAIIANDMERRRINRLEDLEGKRRFLMDFWEKRDENPATPINEFRDEFYRRLQYANDRYSSNRREGWRTDRGRTVIRYGLPSTVEPHLYDRDAAPHEIWEYNNIPGEGQAMFVFADVNGFGEFELIHSSVAGERSLPNWQQELTRF